MPFQLAKEWDRDDEHCNIVDWYEFSIAWRNAYARDPMRYPRWPSGARDQYDLTMPISYKDFHEFRRTCSVRNVDSREEAARKKRRADAARREEQRSADAKRRQDAAQEERQKEKLRRNFSDNRHIPDGRTGMQIFKLMHDAGNIYLVETTDTDAYDGRDGYDDWKGDGEVVGIDRREELIAVVNASRKLLRGKIAYSDVHYHISTDPESYRTGERVSISSHPRRVKVRAVDREAGIVFYTE